MTNHDSLVPCAIGIASTVGDPSHEIRATMFSRAVGSEAGHPTTLAAIAARIRSNDFKGRTEAVRAAPDEERAKALKKLQLPAFIPAVVTARGNEGLTNGTPEYLQVDLDNHKDPHAAYLTLAGLKQDKHVVLAFKSPRGGTKAFIRIDPTRPHEESWVVAEKYVKDTYGADMDKDARGASRLCYYSWDPECYLAPGPVEVMPYPTPTIAAQVSPPVAPAGATTISAVARPPCRKEDVIELLRYIPAMREHDHDHRTTIVGAVSSELADADTVEVCAEWGGVDTSKIENDLAHRKTEFSIGTLIHLAREGGWRPSDAFKAKVSDAEIRKAEDFALQQELDARQFGKGEPPSKPVPRFLLKGIPICTPGNITTIQSQAKTGKTAVNSAMIAAAIIAENGGDTGGDTLARIFHARFSFSIFSGEEPEEVGLASGFSSSQRSGSAAEARTAVFGGRCRRAAVRRERRAGFGIRRRRDYPSAGASCISRAWHKRNRSVRV